MKVTTGRRSMQIVFSASNRLERINASQTIVVQPNAKYRLEFYARTDKLNSASTPVVTVVEAAIMKGLASSAALAHRHERLAKILNRFHDD